MGLKEWAYLLTLSILWGGSFFFIEVCLQSMPPISIAGGRLILAAICLHAFRLIARRSFPRDPKILLRFLILGLLNNAIPFSLLIWGQTFVTGGMASLLIASTPFFTIIIAHSFTSDEKVTLIKFLGILIGLGGVAMIMGVQDADNQLIGKLAVIVTAILYGCGGVYARTLKKYELDPLTTATGQITFAALAMIPVIILIDRPWDLPMPTAISCTSLILMSILTTAVAYIIYFRILASSGATNVLLVTFLNPVSALLLGAIFLGEYISISQIMGILIIGVGLIFIDGRILFRLRDRG